MKLIIPLVIAVTAVFFLNRFDVQIVSRNEQIVSEAVSLDASALQEVVVPESGYTVPLQWGDVGQKLLAIGAVDLDKYQNIYTDPEQLAYITQSMDKEITINRANAYFWVNTLWGLGLTQKSDVLTNGVMGTEYKADLANFASTAGWTLGGKDALELYSSQEIVVLTQEQQDMVSKIANGIYRPCCGNPTSFPDCNHGMAILGLIELMVSQGFSESEIYRAALAFNSYWFEQTYIDLAYYFQKEKNTVWENIDPKLVLSAEYSSAPGYQTIKEQIGAIPGSSKGGASCGA